MRDVFMSVVVCAVVIGALVLIMFLDTVIKGTP